MLQSRLIDIAIDQFGRSGFDGASTRDIARASGTAMSSITYHFGGKEGLYLACADHIAKGIRERNAHSIDLMLDAGTLDRAAAVERCLAIIDSFAQIMLHSDSERWARFIVRDNLRHRRDIERAYLAAIRTATAEIIIASAYFFPGTSFRHELIAAARRCKSGSPSASPALVKILASPALSRPRSTTGGVAADRSCSWRRTDSSCRQ